MRGSAGAEPAREGSGAGPGGAAGGRPSGAAASKLGGCCWVPPALWDEALGGRVPGNSSGRWCRCWRPLAPEQELPAGLPVPSRLCRRQGDDSPHSAPRRNGRDVAAPRARGIPPCGVWRSAQRAGMLAGLSSQSGPCLAVAKKRRSFCEKAASLGCVWFCSAIVCNILLALLLVFLKFLIATWRLYSVNG